MEWPVVGIPMASAEMTRVLNSANYLYSVERSGEIRDCREIRTMLLAKSAEGLGEDVNVMGWLLFSKSWSDRE